MKSKECKMDVKSKRLMRKPEVLELTAIGSSSNLYYLMGKNFFPAPVRLGKKMVAWRASEVFGWIESREKVLLKGGDS